jgi:hypothetical protein
MDGGYGGQPYWIDTSKIVGWVQRSVTQQRACTCWVPRCSTQPTSTSTSGWVPRCSTQPTSTSTSTSGWVPRCSTQPTSMLFSDPKRGILSLLDWHA